MDVYIAFYQQPTDSDEDRVLVGVFTTHAKARAQVDIWLSCFDQFHKPYTDIYLTAIDELDVPDTDETEE